jgi:hypothetical protein
MAYIPENKIPATKSTGLGTTTQTTGVGFNSAASAFGQTVLPLTHYAEAPNSDTITPLPENSTISILTPQQISALGPQLPERPKVKFGELNLYKGFPIEYSAIIDGVKDDSPLADAICDYLSNELGRDGPLFSQITKHKCAEGIEIRFKDLIATGRTLSRVLENYTHVVNFLRICKL